MAHLCPTLEDWPGRRRADAVRTYKAAVLLCHSILVLLPQSKPVLWDSHAEWWVGPPDPCEKRRWEAIRVTSHGSQWCGKLLCPGLSIAVAVAARQGYLDSDHGYQGCGCSLPPGPGGSSQRAIFPLKDVGKNKFHASLLISSISGDPWHSLAYRHITLNSASICHTACLSLCLSSSSYRHPGHIRLGVLPPLVQSHLN